MKYKALIQPFSLFPFGEERVPDINEISVEHIIITRYFLRFYGPKDNVVDEKIWFSKREPIFCDFTLPTIARQLASNFVWILLVEKDCLGLLPPHVHELDYIRVVSWDSDSLNGSTLNYFINELIDERFSKSTSCDTVTVTRIDNDDSLSIDFLTTIERIASIVKNSNGWLETVEDNPIVSFPFGIQITHNKNCSAYIFNNNHFLTSIHYRSVHQRSYANAYSYNHSLIFQAHSPLLLINTDKPMWAEIIHDDNLCN